MSKSSCDLFVTTAPNYHHQSAKSFHTGRSPVTVFRGSFTAVQGDETEVKQRRLLLTSAVLCWGFQMLFVLMVVFVWRAGQQKVR